jgi:hypothetical protein
MIFEIFILIILAMGTIASATNATRANLIGGMLFWFFVGGWLLVATILQTTKIFA